MRHLLLISVLALAGCGDPVEGGFSVDWSITIGGAPASCAEVGGFTVSVLSTLQGTSQAYDDLFDCSDGYGVTVPLPEGDYTIAIDLLDELDGSILTAPFIVEETVFVEGDVVDLPDVEFSF